MARGGKKAVSAPAAANPEAEERNRLKELAFAKSILSQNPAKVGPSTTLGPSKTLIKHHGKDILRKSQRKNKYLFSFPGLLGPISGGKIGELKDLGTKNPILYLDFPQGQMKLFGTIIYPKNRYLTLQFSKGGKNVTCDDYFDNMIVFSDAWWIGTKDENPEELRLEFPEEMMSQKKQAEYDFKGGVGVTCDGKQSSVKKSTKCLERKSPELELEDDSTDSPSDLKETVGVTPVRHSSRTAGKTFNFAEVSSGDDLTGIGVAEMSEEEDEKVDVDLKRNTTDTKTGSLSPVKFEIDNQDAAKEKPASGKNKRNAKSKDASLVQTTLSTLFKKVEEKASKSAKVSHKIEVQEAGTVMKEQKKQLKRTEPVDSVTVYQKKSTKSKGSSGVSSSSRKGQTDSVSGSQSSDPITDSSQVEVDDIEEFSSSSQDMDASDEDWMA